MKISPITILAIILALTAIIGAAASYKNIPSPIEAIPGDNLKYPLGGLAGHLSRESYMGITYVSGEPRRAGYMHERMIEVNGIIIIPAPGEWRDEYGNLYCRGEVLSMLSSADYLEARGYLYSSMMHWHSHTHKVLVTEELVVYRDGSTLHLVHVKGEPRQCTPTPPPHGGMWHEDWNDSGSWERGCCWGGGR